jgi:hypothetical protein
MQPSSEAPVRHKIHLSPCLEGLASLAAARKNRLQTSLNLALGSSIATIGLTIPIVSLTALILGQHVTLGLLPEEMSLLLVTLFYRHHHIGRRPHHDTTRVGPFRDLCGVPVSVRYPLSKAKPGWLRGRALLLHPKQLTFQLITKVGI